MPLINVKILTTCCNENILICWLKYVIKINCTHFLIKIFNYLCDQISNSIGQS